jgi:hypothetical protein
MKKDSLTGLISRATDILFLRNPVRTAMGVIIGAILWGFSPVFSPMIKDLIKLDFSQVHPIAWIAVGILGISLKDSPIKTKLPEDIEMLFDILEKAEKAGISKEETRARFRMILEKYAANVALNQKTQKELEEVKKRLSGD